MPSRDRSRTVCALAVLLALLGAVALVALLLTLRPSDRAAADFPHAGLDFSIDVEGGGCDSSADPTTCDMPAGATFTVDFKLNELPEGLVYDSYDFVIQYTNGLTLHETTLTQQGPGVWPACVFAAHIALPGLLAAGCARGIYDPSSSYTGVLLHIELSCPDNPGAQTVTLVSGAYNTDVTDPLADVHGEGTDEALTVTCEYDPGVTFTPTATATPTRTPTPASTPCLDFDGDTVCDGLDADDDDDGCTDTRELVTGPGAQNSGGNRDPLNGNDYFNPTHDGQNRIDDVLAVLDQYYIDQGNSNYTQDTDRTLIGPNAWNLGPPDGKQRIDDILNMLHQYFHDCA